MEKVCQKCSATSQHEVINEYTECPSCGVVYAKFESISRRTENKGLPIRPENSDLKPNKTSKSNRKLSVFLARLNLAIDVSLEFWDRRNSIQKGLIVFVWFIVTVRMQTLFIEGEYFVSPPRPSCGGTFIADCIERHGLDPHLEGDDRFLDLYNLCEHQCR